MDHEIGTHFLRRANDKLQCWYRPKKRKGSRMPAPSSDVPVFKHCLRTEEGLACLNTVVSQECKLLWRPALHYYAVCRGAVMSFAELFKDLSRYISDPDRCWEQCMRVKRGFEDTSQHGAFAKDQVYLDGAMRILAERHEL